MILEVRRGEITVYWREEVLEVTSLRGALQLNSSIPRGVSADLKDERTLVVESSRCRVVVHSGGNSEAAACIVWGPGEVEVTLGAMECKGVEVGERMIVDVDSGEVLREGVNLHVFNLDEAWFRRILEGEKTVEGRVYDLKRRRVKPGHYILFRCGEGRVYAKVMGVRVYPSFRAMLEAEGVERVLPGVGSLEEAVSVYRSYYSEAEEEKFGVVAIEISLDWGCSRSSP